MTIQEQRKYVVDAKLAPKGYQQISDLSSAVKLTPPTGARVALVQALTQSVRWLDDGNDPDASTGMVLAAGTDMLYTGNLAVITFIEIAGGAELNVTYYE